MCFKLLWKNRKVILFCDKFQWLTRIKNFPWKSLRHVNPWSPQIFCSFKETMSHNFYHLKNKFSGFTRFFDCAKIHARKLSVCVVADFAKSDSIFFFLFEHCAKMLVLIVIDYTNNTEDKFWRPLTDINRTIRGNTAKDLNVHSYPKATHNFKFREHKFWALRFNNFFEKTNNFSKPFEASNK